MNAIIEMHGRGSARAGTSPWAWPDQDAMLRDNPDIKAKVARIEDIDQRHKSIVRELSTSTALGGSVRTAVEDAETAEHRAFEHMRGHVSPETEGAYRKAQLAKADAKAEFTRVQQRTEEERAAARAPARNHKAIGDYLPLMQQHGFEHHPVDVPRGATLESTIAALRKTEAEVADLSNAPMTLSEAIAAMKDDVASRARRPTVTVGAKSVAVQLPWANRSNSQQGGDDVVGMLFWLHQDTIIEALEADLRAEFQGVEGIPGKDRSKRLAALREQTEELSRIACALVWREIEGGRETPFPTDDPRYILGVDGPKPRKAF